MGNDQSKKAGKSSSSGTPVGRRRRFECIVHVEQPKSPETPKLLVCDGGGDSGGGGDGGGDGSAATITLLGTAEEDGVAGKSRTFEADGVFACDDAKDDSHLHTFYSKHLSTAVRQCCANDQGDGGANLLIWTILNDGQGNGIDGGLLPGLVCSDVLDALDAAARDEKSSNEDDAKANVVLSLSFLSVPAGPSGETDDGAYDCLVQSTNSAPPELLSAERARGPLTEVVVRSGDQVDKVLKCAQDASAKAVDNKGQAGEGGQAHSLVTITARILSDSADDASVATTRRIRILNLAGSVGVHKPAPSKGASKGGGGRGGRKGGRGWKSHDTRRAAASASAAAEEDRTVRAVRRIVDYLSRRFRNVPYDDSILTGLVRDGFEPGGGRSVSVAIFGVGGGSGSGSVEEGGKGASSWQEGTAATLEFMEKVMGVTMPEEGGGDGTAAAAAAVGGGGGGAAAAAAGGTVQEIVKNSNDWWSAVGK